MSLTMASGFSGGGLYDIGAAQAGFTPISAIEYEEAIAEVYAANIGNHVHVGRIQEVDWHKMERPDLYHMSPVCKAFSTANVSGEEGAEELSQAEAVAAMIRTLEPTCFTLENVTQYRTSRSIEIIRKALSEKGYAFDEQNVNSADFGTPQTRRRFILRAVRRGSVPPLRRTHVDPTRQPQGMESLFGDEYAALPWNGWFRAVEDLLDDLPTTRFADWQLARLKDYDFSFLTQAGNTQSNGYQPRPPEMPRFTCDTYSPQKAFLVSQDYGNSNTDAERVLLTRSASEPSVTIKSTSTGVPKAFLINSNNQRAFVVDCQASEDFGLTTRYGEERFFTVTGSAEKRPARAWLERGRVVSMSTRCLARFQDLPDSYLLPAKNSLASMIIGNGIPCRLARAIAESMKDAL